GHFSIFEASLQVRPARRLRVPAHRARTIVTRSARAARRQGREGRDRRPTLLLRGYIRGDNPRYTRWGRMSRRSADRTTAEAARSSSRLLGLNATEKPARRAAARSFA